MSFSWYGNKTGKGYFGAMRPRFDKASGSMIVYGVLGADVVSFECEKVSNWHQTILSRDEYFHLYPVAEAAPDADGWIEWSGGKCPVERESLVDYKLLSGTVCVIGEAAGDLIWQHGEVGTASIIAYRLHKPEVKHEFCESVTRSIPEPESIDGLCAKVTEENKHQHVDAKPTIEQLAQDYRNRKDYADRKQAEADAAKADAEDKLAELVAAGKAIGLVLSVEHEVSVITPALPQLIAGDWRSWRQWEVGDLISWSIVGHIGEFRIISVHHDQSRNIGDFEVEDKHGGVYRVYGNECRFIRRP